jgi:hypothetical protein
MSDVKYTPEFEEFWSVYPRKKGKMHAFFAFQDAVNMGMPIGEELANIVLHHLRTRQWQAQGGLYIPHPTRWLQEHRWEDQIYLNEITLDVDNNCQASCMCKVCTMIREVREWLGPEQFENLITDVRRQMYDATHTVEE